ASPGFQPQQDPLGPAPTATALRPSATAGSPDMTVAPSTSLAQPSTSLAQPSTDLKTTPSSAAATGHTWRVIPPPPRSGGQSPGTVYRPVDPKPRPDATSADMSPAED